ncbi:Mur ligase family protein, partial [Treponema sp. R6D11]
ISHVLRELGKCVGTTSTSGTFIDGKCVCKGDHSGPCSAKSLLANKNIECAVFETARGGIIRSGLGYDQADVAVITNIGNDHIGLDGVETIEDIAYVKSLVAEAVRDDGFVVLNAEDEMTSYIINRAAATPILFYKNKDNIKFENYEQFVNVFIQDNKIKILDNGKLLKVAEASEIPITN